MAKKLKNKIITELVPEDRLVPSSKYPYIKFPFPTLNRVQSTLFNEGYDKDANFILGTTTSSGKTVCAELFIGETLKRKKKIIYLSPLKSLTQEKYDDWRVKFPKKKIAILTGDYVLKETKARELITADIICMTSEMADSRSRKADTEKSEWLFDVDLIVIDETHIIGTERGHAVEVGLMRLATIIPKARIVCLSATLMNINDFSNWLTTINGKQTISINSDWRPVELTWHYIEYNSMQRYHDKQEEIKFIGLETIKTKPDQKFLCFVHSKKVGREFVKLLRHHNIKADFHSADLKLASRLKLEKSFESRSDKSLRILVSTSTLAWGRSLPARNVLILDTKRGMNDVDILDIIQMGGRAGRLGIDPDGSVYLICPDARHWEAMVKLQRPIKSQLLDLDILGFHILAEIRIKSIKKYEDIKEWYKRSLAYEQQMNEDDIAEEAIEQLTRLKMMKVNERTQFYKLTFLGTLSANLYFIPKDIAHLARIGRQTDVSDEWDNSVFLAYLYGGLPSKQLPYVPQDLKDIADAYLELARYTGLSVNQSALSAATFSYLEGGRQHFLVTNFKHDVNRITEVLLRMQEAFKWMCTTNRMKTISARMQYGVKDEHAKLCLLPDIGRERAANLYALGIKSYNDIKERNKELIATAIGSEKVADRVIAFVEAARDKKRKQLKRRDKRK